MGNVFTRKAVSEIMGNGQLTDEQKTEQVFALYGRALEDGYIAKAAAQQARETALEQARAEWEKDIVVPDPRESDDYKALQGQFDDYKAMQAARTSKDFEGVKPKFFEVVYGMVDRGEGAKSLREQLAGIREQYEEYFAQDPSTGSRSNPAGGTFGGIPTVVLPSGGKPGPGARMTLGEAMMRANAGEAVDVSRIGK